MFCFKLSCTLFAFFAVIYMQSIALFFAEAILYRIIENKYQFCNLRVIAFCYNSLVNNFYTSGAIHNLTLGLYLYVIDVAFGFMSFN